MEVSEKRERDRVHLKVKGRLDAFTAPSFEKRVMGLINEGFHFLDFDFEEIKYISSAGLKVLLMALKVLDSHHGNITIHKSPKHVKDVLDCTGFSCYFVFVDN